MSVRLEAAAFSLRQSGTNLTQSLFRPSLFLVLTLLLMLSGCRGLKKQFQVGFASSVGVELACEEELRGAYGSETDIALGLISYLGGDGESLSVGVAGTTPLRLVPPLQTTLSNDLRRLPGVLPEPEDALDLRLNVEVTEFQISTPPIGFLDLTAKVVAKVALKASLESADTGKLIWREQYSTRHTKETSFPGVIAMESTLKVAYCNALSQLGDSLGGEAVRAAMRNPESVRVAGEPISVERFAGLNAISGLAWAKGHIWASLANERRLIKMRPSDGVVVGSISTGGVPSKLLYAKGSLWVSCDDGTVWRVDSDRVKAVATITIEGEPSTLGAWEGSVWVADSRGGVVSRIDPETNKVSRTIPVESPLGLAFHKGLMWVSNSQSGTLHSFDLGSGKERGEPIPLGEGAGHLLSAAGELLVAHQRHGVVSINPATRKMTNIYHMATGAHHLAAGSEGVWAKGLDAGSVLEIFRAGSSKVTRTHLQGGLLEDITAGGSFIWVSDTASESLLRLR